MTDADSATPAQSDLYREMACAIRALIPLMKYSEARDQLCLLALQYEKLAQSLEGRVQVFAAPELGGVAPRPHGGRVPAFGHAGNRGPPAES
jgi:hypothetical protein